MTERERIALLDFCTQKFQAEHCFVGRSLIEAPPIKRVPLIQKKRSWASIGFSGFKVSMPEEVSEGNLQIRWVAQIIGQRSDGQMFAVNLTVPHEFEPIGDRVEYVDAVIHEALGKFESYKDCSCGIIGYEKTEEKDDDGDYIFRSITSPCELHPLVTEPKS